MTTLCIQIQPDRIADFDQAAVLAVCEQMRAHKPLIAGFQWDEGDDEGPYINLLFETEQPAEVWPILQAAFYAPGALGDAIRATSMAMCTGEEGWEDYLLLYHYDDQLPLDSF
ncbi:hypothetical protein [Chitinimonas naiadis]